MVVPTNAHILLSKFVVARKNGLRDFAKPVGGGIRGLFEFYGAVRANHLGCGDVVVPIGTL